MLLNAGGKNNIQTFFILLGENYKIRVLVAMRINTNVYIGDKLRIARLHKGLSLDEFAKKIGVSKVLLWEIENRSVENLDMQILYVIFNELDIACNDVLGSYI